MNTYNKPKKGFDFKPTTLEIKRNALIYIKVNFPYKIDI